MGAGEGLEARVSPLLQVLLLLLLLLLLEYLLLLLHTALPRLLDQRDPVPDGLAHHLGIALVEEA